MNELLSILADWEPPAGGTIHRVQAAHHAADALITWDVAIAIPGRGIGESRDNRTTTHLLDHGERAAVRRLIHEDLTLRFERMLSQSWGGQAPSTISA